MHGLLRLQNHFRKTAAWTCFTTMPLFYGFESSAYVQTPDTPSLFVYLRALHQTYRKDIRMFSHDRHKFICRSGVLRTQMKHGVQMPAFRARIVLMIDIIINIGDLHTFVLQQTDDLICFPVVSPFNVK